MAAGKHGSSEITVSYDDSPGGTLRAITNFVLTLGAVKITANMQASMALGDAWEESLPTGTQKVDDIPIHGFWDDTAVTGPHVVFLSPDANPQAATRTLTIVFGNSKTFTVESYLMSYAVLGRTNNLTEFDAVIRPTGAAVWS